MTSYVKKKSENFCLVELFEEKVKEYPSKIAVREKNKYVTYKELNDLVNRLSCYLLSEGISNKVVALCMEESIELITSILAILKTKNILVPIDISINEDRMNYILQNSEAEYLIHSGLESSIKLSKNVKSLDINSIDLSNLKIDLGKQIVFPTIDQEDLAYIIYTSGTTGTPKGVPIKHTSIKNSLTWRRNEYGFTSEDRIIQLLSFSFDGFILSSLSPLVSGAQLILTDSFQKKDPRIVVRLIKEYQITHFICIPSFFENILEFGCEEDFSSIRSVTLAGEKTSPKVFEKMNLLNLKFEITNEYGPTENSVVTTIKRNYSLNTINNIGKPIDNVDVFVINDSLERVSVGEVGEIVIGGIGLTPGYIKEPKLNQEKFIRIPSLSKGILYKTGDLGQLCENGEIKYVGRIDEQIKIRGFRIETEEIENVILKYKGVKSSIVVTKDDFGANPILVAYLKVDNSEKEFDKNKLFEYLSNKLPEYMIPNAIKIVNDFPLLNNGKINKKLLPQPVYEDFRTSVRFEEPVTSIEKELSNIWKEILGVEKISRNDNFFFLGGTSLTVALLLNKIRKKFNCSLEIIDIYADPTLMGISRSIQEKETENEIFKIKKRTNAKKFPLGSTQRNIWFLEKNSGMLEAYCIPMLLEFEGEVNLEILIRSFNELILKHEILRTSIIEYDGIPFNVVNTESHFTIEHIDVQDENEKNIIKDIILNETNKSINLNNKSLIKGFILHRNQGYKILLLINHIIFDGISAKLFIKELAENYNNLLNNKNILLTNNQFQYKDYIKWQEEFSKTDEYKNQLNYWLHKLDKDPPLLSLPYDNRIEGENVEGDTYEFFSTSQLYQSIKKLSDRLNTTNYTLILTGLAIYLFRLTGQNDISIGSPVSNRDIVGTEEMIGLLVNTVVNKINLDKQMTIRESIRAVHKEVLEVLRNSKVPFEKIVEKINPKRTYNKNPFFNVFFSLQENNFEYEINNLKIRSIELDNFKSKFDLSIFVEPRQNKYLFKFNYNNKLFKKTTIQRMAEQFIRILVYLENLDDKIGEISILTESDIELWNSYNDTAVGMPEDWRRIIDRFESIAANRPNNIALVFEGDEYSYDYLNRKANQLARYLISKNEINNGFIAILMDKSVEMIISMLAVLKINRPYVPIDTSYPSKRIEYILKDTNPVLVLSSESVDPSLKTANTIDVDNIAVVDEINNMDDYDLDCEVDNEDEIAYITYTSGSTGLPKGVMTTKKGVINYLNFLINRFNINDNDSIIQMASFSFDASTRDILGTLSSGARLVMLESWKYKDANIILKSIKDNKITKILSLVPSTLRFLIDHSDNNGVLDNCLELMLLSGEVLLWEDIQKARKLFGNRLTIVNQYGPTECTMTSSYYIVPANYEISDKFGSVPIGRPINNRKIYVLDENMSIVPPGTKGEIYIGGFAVSKGYLNKSQLTSEAFISDPFEENSKLYRTGDIGFLDDNQNLVFVGRKDTQIKIRGIRVELKEIEEVIRKYPSVKDVIIVNNKEHNENKLTAYIIIEKGLGSIDLIDMKLFIKKYLPDYMIPQEFFVVDQFPTLPNGKVNKNALSSLNATPLRNNNYSDELLSTVEKRLIEIWKDILNKDVISKGDNFFDLGGHSLMILKTTYRIQEEFFVEITIKEFFENPILSKLAALIEQKQKSKNKKVTKPIIKSLIRNSLNQTR